MSCSENRTELLEYKLSFGVISLFGAKVYAIIHLRLRRPSFPSWFSGCADSIIAWMMPGKSCVASVKD